LFDQKDCLKKVALQFICQFKWKGWETEEEYCQAQFSIKRFGVLFEKLILILLLACYF
jgi:hypothetical protein